MNQKVNLREKLNFEYRILSGSADDAIKSIHQIRDLHQLMQLHSYETHHNHRKSVNRALIQRFKHLAQQQEKHSRH